MGMWTPRRVVTVASIAAGAYLLVVVGVYVAFLGELRVSRTDPEPWGQFADYIGGLLDPLLALANVAVVAYLALVVQDWNELKRKQELDSEERVRTVLDLHREWNSESNYRSRVLAGQLVREHPGASMLDIERITEPERAVHVWIVIGFFLRLGYLAKHDKLRDDMAIELFGELFVWWWIVSFERQLMTVDWDAADQVRELQKWLYSRTTEAQRAPWIRRALNDSSVSPRGPQATTPAPPRPA